MIKTNDRNKKLLNRKNFSQVELTFNSNNQLNTLLCENSKNIDKLNEITDLEIRFFGNKLIIVGENQNIELAEILINKVYDMLLLNKNNNQSIDFSIFESEYKMLKNKNYQFLGRSPYNQSVYINEETLPVKKPHEKLIGSIFNVKIIKSNQNSLLGNFTNND